jgi:hypothetical protein
MISLFASIDVDCMVFELKILNYLLLFNQAMTALSMNESQYEMK